MSGGWGGGYPYEHGGVRGGAVPTGRRTASALWEGCQGKRDARAAEDRGARIRPPVQQRTCQGASASPPGAVVRPPTLSSTLRRGGRRRAALSPLLSPLSSPNKVALCATECALFTSLNHDSRRCEKVLNRPTREGTRATPPLACVKHRTISMRSRFEDPKERRKVFGGLGLTYDAALQHAHAQKKSFKQFFMDLLQLRGELSPEDEEYLRNLKNSTFTTSISSRKHQFDHNNAHHGAVSLRRPSDGGNFVMREARDSLNNASTQQRDLGGMNSHFGCGVGGLRTASSQGGINGSGSQCHQNTFFTPTRASQQDTDNGSLGNTGKTIKDAIEVIYRLSQIRRGGAVLEGGMNGVSDKLAKCKSEKEADEELLRRIQENIKIREFMLRFHDAVLNGARSSDLIELKEQAFEILLRGQGTIDTNLLSFIHEIGAPQRAGNDLESTTGLTQIFGEIAINNGDAMSITSDMSVSVQQESVRTSNIHSYPRPVESPWPSRSGLDPPGPVESPWPSRSGLNPPRPVESPWSSRFRSGLDPPSLPTVGESKSEFTQDGGV